MGARSIAAFVNTRVVSTGQYRSVVWLTSAAGSTSSRSSVSSYASTRGMESTPDQATSHPHKRRLHCTSYFVPALHFNPDPGHQPQPHKRSLLPRVPIVIVLCMIRMIDINHTVLSAHINRPKLYDSAVYHPKQGSIVLFALPSFGSQGGRALLHAALYLVRLPWALLQPAAVRVV